MFPFVFIGDLEIRTHFILTLIGIFSGFLLLFYNIRDLDNKTKTSMFLLAIFIFLPFLIGGWLGYEVEIALINKKIFFSKKSLFESFSLMWGLALSAASAFLFAKLLKINVWSAGDNISMSIAMGGFFVKLGCFFNGCCFGIPAPEKFPFGVCYPYNSYPQMLFGDKLLFPSQLFESITWLCIFIFLIIRKKYKQFDGELIIFMFILFGISRFLIEFTRYHENYVLISTGHIFSLIIIIISIILYSIKKSNNKSYKKLDKTLI